MKQRIICFLILMFLCFIFAEPIYAQEEVNTIIGSEIDKFNMGELDEILEESGIDLSFEEMALETVETGVVFSPSNIVSNILENFFKEINNQFHLMGQIMIISIVSAFLRNLEDAFGGKNVPELGFYVCYIILIYIVMMSFYENMNMVLNLIEELIILLKQMIPYFISFLAFSGYVTESAIMGPVIMSATSVISYVIKQFIIPGIALATILEISNNISDKNLLKSLSEFLKKIIEYSLKGCALIFVTITTLQKTTASGIGGLIGKTAKGVINAVPVVGDIMTGAIETATGLTGLLKNTFMVGTVIVIGVMIMLPVLKLIVIYLIYKCSAALMEPISEKRLIKALNSAGDFTALLIVAVFIVSSMFLFSVIILLVG